MVVFNSWRELMAGLNQLDEETLKDSINYEVSVYGRKRFIERMHQRYSRLRADRERTALVAKEMLL